MRRLSCCRLCLLGCLGRCRPRGISSVSFVGRQSSGTTVLFRGSELSNGAMVSTRRVTVGRLVEKLRFSGRCLVLAVVGSRFRGRIPSSGMLLLVGGVRSGFGSVFTGCALSSSFRRSSSCRSLCVRLANRVALCLRGCNVWWTEGVGEWC